MTDNEIIKALECCASSCSSEACKNCPFDEKGVCTETENALAIYALDLINRRKAEKEALINGQETLQKYIAEQNSEISILKDSNINLRELYYTEREKVRKAKQKVMDACKMRKTARAEAIKEFAERLKKNAIAVDVLFGFGREHYTEAVTVIAIDSIVKEMVGE